MAFPINLSPTYFWPVELKVQMGGETNVGRLRSYSFEAEFRRISQTRRDEIIRQAIIGSKLLNGETIDESRLESMMTSKALADEVWVGWRKVLDGEGPDSSEVPFSEVQKRELLEIEDVADAVVLAWYNSKPGAKLKN